MGIKPQTLCMASRHATTKPPVLNSKQIVIKAAVPSHTRYRKRVRFARYQE